MHGKRIVWICCERGGKYQKKKDKNIRSRKPYRTKKCECAFTLKGEQIIGLSGRKLYVKDVRHNQNLGYFTNGHALAAKMTDEQIQLTDELNRYHVKQ